MLRITVLSTILLAAACTHPRDRCAADVNDEISAVDLLIETTAGNIERGYALDTSKQITTGLQLCTGSNVRFCVGGQRSTPPKTVAIDIAAERQKLEALNKERQNLSDQLHWCANVVA